MAAIVLGVCSARSPMLSMPDGLWSFFEARDRQATFVTPDGSRRGYEDLLAAAGDRYRAALAPSVWHQQYLATQRALSTLRQAVRRAAPDLLVVFGDDETEWFTPESTPQLAAYCGRSWWVLPRSFSERTDVVGRATAWSWGAEERAHPVAADVTRFVVERLAAEGYRVETIDRAPQGKGAPHGFGFVYQRLVELAVPVVPLLVNVHYPPHQPRPEQAYALGQAVARAVAAWPARLRVAVVGTGGLGVGLVQPELDRTVLAALERRDPAALAGLPAPWVQGPTGEVLNWVGAAGALEHLRMQVIDYVPAVRTPAGTGCGMAFALWQ